jgi:hypothetical protein
MQIKVDTNWYLEQNPDVAAAGMDPQLHYEHYGAGEGRLPYALHSAELETALWGGFSNFALGDLQAMTSDPHQPDLERLYSRWALMRWYAGTEEWDKALEFTREFNAAMPLFADHLGVHLLCAEVLQQCGYIEEARARVAAAMARFGTVPDLCLAAANAGLQCSECKTDPIEAGTDNEASLRLHWINTLFRGADLMPVQKRAKDAPPALGNLAGGVLGKNSKPGFSQKKLAFANRKNRQNITKSARFADWFPSGMKKSVRKVESCTNLRRLLMHESGHTA